MNFDNPIDKDFLRTLPEYKQDGLVVDFQGPQQDVYSGEPVKRLDEIKSDYGNGVR